MARYFNVHPVDPQRRAISQVVELIRDGGLIVYPTDSCFALGCQLGNPDGLRRIREIRALDDKHHFTLVCRDFAQLGQFVHVSNTVFRLIKASIPGSYTFILPATKEVPRGCCGRRRRLSECGSRSMPSRRRCSPSWTSRCCRLRCCCPTSWNR